jgi:hypothetical protein
VLTAFSSIHISEFYTVTFCVSELPFKPILQVLSLADSLGIAELKAFAVSFTCAHFQDLFPTGESLGAALASRSRLLQELLASNQLILRRRNGVILAGRDLEVSVTGFLRILTYSILHCPIRNRHTYLIHVAMSPVLHVCLVFWSARRVFVAFHLSIVLSALSIL